MVKNTTNHSEFGGESKLGELINFDGVKGLVKAGVFAAVVSSAPVFAQDNGVKQENVDTKVSAPANQAGITVTGYDKNNNIFNLQTPAHVKVGGPIATAQVDTISKSKFKDNFDVNNDGEVSKIDIEQIFGFKLSDFNSIYSGDTSYFYASNEIKELVAREDELLKQKSLAKDDAEIKKINTELSSIYTKIDNKKNELYLKYFEELSKKVNSVLEDDNKKISFLSNINQTNLELNSFYNFVLSNLKYELEVEPQPYKEKSYISEDISSNLVSKLNIVDMKSFTSEELSYCSNNFIDLRDCYNIKLISFAINTQNVFEALGDTNHDGKNAKKGVYTGGQIISILNNVENQMTLEGNEEQFYKNLSYIFSLGGVKVELKDKSTLVALLKTDTLSKLKFYDGLNYLTLKGVDISYVLKNGQEGIKMWEKSKEKIYNDPKIGILYKRLEKQTTDLPSKLAELRTKKIITDEQYKQDLENLNKTISRPGFMDNLLAQAIGLLQSVSASYLSDKGSLSGGVKFTYNNKVLTPKESEFIKKFSDKIELDIGAVNTSSGNMMMLGLVYNVDYTIDESQKFTTGIGSRLGIGKSTNVLPVANLGYTKISNLDELKKLDIKNFENIGKSTHFVGASVSMLNVSKGLTSVASYSKKDDLLGGADLKSKIYLSQLDKLLEYDGTQSLEQFIEGIEKKLTSKDFEGINFLKESLPRIYSVLNSDNFNSGNTATKKQIIAIIKEMELQKYISGFASYHEKKGVQWTGWGLNLGIIPFGAQWSSISQNFTPNQAKKSISAQVIYSQSGEKIQANNLKILSNFNKLVGLEGVNVKYENGLLKFSSENGNILESKAIKFFANPNVISQVSYQNGEIIVGDVGDITIYSANSKSGDVIYIVAGQAEGIGKKLLLTNKSESTLTGNIPTSINETSTKIRKKDISVENEGIVNSKDFGLFM